MVDDINAPNTKKALDDIRDLTEVAVQLCDELACKLHRNKIGGHFFVDKVLCFSKVIEEVPLTHEKIETDEGKYKKHF